ncbi:type VI secretion system secreted protein VgrG [Novosphingobium sp. CF614]|uniref:type VI secretion system Vgr family protein n=1 Tax=Novosphingobium sp. CF614 TaxID=1884364 RepID=UPI0008E2DB90|nr:type VI secretion system tip protein TssI/VgrG [Novosphingobium sp. CF614]SFF95120.1 type VI secretion system secreted protein VgrG [Novosphingobium sp. CF614]
MEKHLLNLRVLADAPIEDYALLGFEGREEISQPFDYRLELVTNSDPDLTGWIGKLAEFDIYPGQGQERVFAGRIYAARKVVGDELTRVFVQVRPAYHALSYASATHFIQDKTSVEIFEGMTGDVTGLVKTMSVSPPPPKRGYAVRYDESEIGFLGRLLAQDGIMYFFVYDRSAGAYRHKMIVTNKPADYVDIAAGPVQFMVGGKPGEVESLERQVAAAPRKHKHVSFNVNKLDTPFLKASSSPESWGAVYSHEYETIGFEALAEGDVAARQKATDEHGSQSTDRVEGTSTEPSFMAGGRAEIKGGEPLAPRRVVLTSVSHSAHDPWMFQDPGTATYSNHFTAIDAAKSYRPPVDVPARQAPGPMLGVVSLDGASTGEIKVDKEWRVPVAISNARDYDKFDKVVWLPVQQQWAHATHGAQFFPRVGTRVIIDFLYGNPDLPFITGTVYTPAQAYPFDPASKVTQSGWRSVTEKNGAIVQEFHFEDKKGEEEIYLYTGRDFRREIDNDDWGTVKNNQTLEVQQDRKRTVKGLETVDVTKTRTVTVTDKNLLESKKEVEIKVGPSTIKLTMQGIEITAPQITIKADVKLDMSGGATAALKAPKTDVTADAMLTLKGGIVMIN